MGANLPTSFADREEALAKRFRMAGEAEAVLSMEARRILLRRRDTQ